jgi:hypothetical protein
LAEVKKQAIHQAKNTLARLTDPSTVDASAARLVTAGDFMGMELIPEREG